MFENFIEGLTNFAQFMGIVVALIGLFSFLKGRRREAEQAVLSRYIECTANLVRHYENCRDFDPKLHVFDIAGLVPDMDMQRYKRAIQFQILLTRLEESHLLYEHPEDSVQLMSRVAWQSTLFLWLRNSDLRRVIAYNRNYVSAAFYRSTDLFLAMHRHFEIKQEEFGNGYTTDPADSNYTLFPDQIAELQSICRHYTDELKFAPHYLLNSPRRTNRRVLCFFDGCHIRADQDPVQFAILSYLLRDDSRHIDQLQHASYWMDVAVVLNNRSKITLVNDPLYRLV